MRLIYQSETVRVWQGTYPLPSPEDGWRRISACSIGTDSQGRNVVEVVDRKSFEAMSKEKGFSIETK